MPSYEGRLELTWTNKHLRLLAHDDGSYEWLDPSDYRVAEVRLLHDVEAVGETGKRRAADNLLIRGDALHGLTSLTKLPEFSREYLGKVFDGLGPKAAEVLSAHLGRAGARLIRLVETEQRRSMAKPSYDQVIDLKTFAPARATDKTVSPDRFGTFSKSAAYNSWKRSLYAVEWFDSRPERDVANTIDESDEIACWVRLHIGELPILWSSAGRQYNPDFLVVEAGKGHWVVEVKSDKDMSSDEVQAKRQAARRWASHVNAAEEVDVTWRYLLISESDITAAKGSWSALKSLGE